jgi:hypothetical protein
MFYVIILLNIKIDVIFTLFPIGVINVNYKNSN